MPREEAGAAVERMLREAIGPEAAVEIAQAQVRVAWEEVVAEAGLARGGMRSRLVRVANGIGQVEASEPILANELRLRGEALAWAVNRRMAGRPGATIALRGVAVSVARFE